MIFEQKVIRIGNSLGVIIPKRLADYLSWKAGTVIDMNYDSRRKAIVIRDKKGKGIKIVKKI